MDPTPEQVAAAREHLYRWYDLDIEPRDFDAPTNAQATDTILAHLDAVERELAEARAAIDAAGVLLYRFEYGDPVYPEERRSWLDMPAVKRAMEEE